MAWLAWTSTRGALPGASEPSRARPVRTNVRAPSPARLNEVALGLVGHHLEGYAKRPTACRRRRTSTRAAQAPSSPAALTKDRARKAEHRPNMEARSMYEKSSRGRRRLLASVVAIASEP